MSQAPDRSSPRRNLDDDVASPNDQQRAGSRRRSSRERRTRVVGPRHPPPAPEAAAAAPRSAPDDDDDDAATPSHPRREASSPRWRGYRRASSSSSSGGFAPSPSSSPPPSSPRSSYSSPSHHHHHHRAVSSLLSSRASDMGRRLAQERSRNRTLTRRISELEDALSLLRHGDIVANGDDPIRRGDGDDDDDDDDASSDDPTWEESAPSFSSHPAETPPRVSRRLPAKLEEASSRSGTKPRREAAEEEEGAANLVPPSTSARAGVADVPSPRTATTIEISGGDRSSVEDVLDRAAELMARGGGIRRNGTTADGSSAAGVTTRERMHEYRELVTAFHSEQISHADLDGEELVPRVDVSWLLNELRWRYEDILDGYEEERRSGQEECDNSHHDRELRECVESLAGIVRKAIESPPAHRNDRDHRSDPSIADDDARILQDEISSLNQRLASFAWQHKEICSSHYDDVEAMKRDFLEQLENKSQFAHHLESKISEQKEYIVRIQNEAQKAWQSMQEEKRNLALSKEGMSARIRYLEGMLRSLQVELKERVNRELQGAASTPPPVFLRDLTSAMREMDPWDDEDRIQIGAANSPPPMFPRDLASPIRDADPRDESSQPPVFPCDPTSRNADRRHENPMRDEADATDELECSRGEARPSVDGADDIATLREQIASLGSSLAESETRRADMLEDFQRERREYMSQYERLSDVLKKLIEERGNAIVLGDDVSVQML